MNALDVAAATIDVLNKIHADYMLVGSLSSNLYGIPRNTNDADFVLAAQTTEILLISSALGAGFRLDPQLSFESVTATQRRVINHPETGFILEFFQLSDDPHDCSRFSRKRRIEMLNRFVFVPTVEDVLVTKLRWSKLTRRDKDISDAKNILAVQGAANIDMNYVRQWTSIHGTNELLDRLLAQISNA
ncbi:MAG TPA: hypothetical protein VMG59_05230 [Phycisphaerae bacterium]|nr:hypothetical protein [Phycisphaerae bacterium]